MLEQFVKNCSPWEGPTLEKFVEDCLPWVGPYAGAGEECEGKEQQRQYRSDICFPPVFGHFSQPPRLIKDNQEWPSNDISLSTRMGRLEHSTKAAWHLSESMDLMAVMSLALVMKVTSLSRQCLTSQVLSSSKWERGVRICERNNSADTKVNEEGGGGGAPGAGAEIPLQPMVKTMVRQVVPLQPMEVHGGADIHLQPVEDPMPEQGWRLNHFPGQPVPMLDNPFSEEKFPNIQSKPPLAQLEAISSCPIACYLGEETDTQLSTTSFQAKQSQLPQPLLIRLLLQTLHQLRCPSLDTLQHLNVSLVVRGPKLNTVFEVRPHQCRVQGHDHFPSPAGHTIPDTSQDAIGFLGRLGTLLGHIQAAVNQHPQVLLCQAAFQPLFPKPEALHGVAVAQVQDLALSLVKTHTIDLGPSIQPVRVPLQSLLTLQQINTPT
ncbi:hypothetical protein QYF61_013361 [Mycteria americana]|uniref:Uncharacterized protein n=1 Tax=Mycteria americana TaxID=33587 RepID=A0AAN7NHM2_MYCAM|nr:hypothetical protein QYF61_013361 [Mycteria americana]